MMLSIYNFRKADVVLVLCKVTLLLPGTEGHGVD